MRVLIAGSRTITDALLLDSLIRVSGFDVTEIISGMARGVDRLAWEWGKAHGIPVDEHPADWAKHGRSAGFRRNEEMAKLAEAAIIIWDGKSHGTAHMLQLVRTRKLPLFLYQGNLAA